MRITKNEFEKLIVAKGLHIGKPRNKHNAVKTVVDNITFASKAEAEYYRQLKHSQSIGTISYFLRQVPFTLPGGTKYIVDFMIVHRNGTISYVDVKGQTLASFVRSKKQVEALYPVVITVVKLIRGVFVEV